MTGREATRGARGPIAIWVLIGAVLLVLGGALAAVALRQNQTSAERRYAPSGAGYSFVVPAGFELIYVKEPSPPEGMPASGHRSDDGIVISAWWDGPNAAPFSVTSAMLPAETARLTAVIRREEAENRSRVLRKRASYSGFVRGPDALALAGRPARHFLIERMDVSGESLRATRQRSDSYVVFKGRTPFRLECIWPLGEVADANAREACATVLQSLRLTRAPITG